MDLLNTVRKSGSRGGVNFQWSDVASSSHRENYLGHSLMAPVGRWQQGKDLSWYAKGDGPNGDEKDGETPEERAARERRDEMRKVKEAEEDAMARALGLPPPQRDVSGANAIELEGPKRVIGPALEEATKDVGEAEDKRERHRRKRDRDDGTSRRHRRDRRDSKDRSHRRSHRNRSRSRERRPDRNRSPRRQHDSRERRPEKGDDRRRRDNNTSARDTGRDSERRDRGPYRDRSRSPERRDRRRSRSRDDRRQEAADRRRSMSHDAGQRRRRDRDEKSPA